MSDSLYLNSLPRPITFRVWESRIRKMHYPKADTVMWPPELAQRPYSGSVQTFALDVDGHLVLLYGWSQAAYLTTSEGDILVPLSYTGLRTGGTIGRDLYEGDIISFAIKGVTHGRERDECKAAHIWWNQDDACWAFGRWTQTIPAPRGMENQPPHTYTWWYSMMDDIDRSSITLLGNIFENPELIPPLGYSPQL